MPPKTPMPSPAGWRCPQCTLRSFSTSAARLAVGPEHPRYIAIPEPPQQTVPDRPPVKGVLPVPRDVFAGIYKGWTSDEDFLAAATPDGRKIKAPAKGSREEWKAKITEMRKQNLREGFTSLRARQQMEMRRIGKQSKANQERREELLHAPEREDERLTAPSNNLDLDALFGKTIPDPNREERLETKRRNLDRFAQQKKQQRMEALHTLYMNARDFIVTPQQLDAAVDKEFGTPEQPKLFSTMQGEYDYTPRSRSVWAEGRPERIQDMLNKATGQQAASAMESAGRRTAQLSNDRIRRIAEALTGGKMEKEARR